MTMPRLLSRLFSAESMGLVLVAAALQAFAYGIASSLRHTDTKYFFWVCLIGALIAFGLSKRRATAFGASVWMILLGILGVWVLGARLAPPLFDFVITLIKVVPQIIPAIRADIPIDTTAIAETWTVVAEASGALSVRVQTWMMSLNRNVIVNDALVRNMVWVLIMWLVSAWTGWFAGRRNAMAALLPPVIMLAFVISYSERRIETLWIMVFILLLLLGIWNYKNHTIQWERRSVDYSDSIRYDVAQAVVLLSLAIGAMAFLAPSISWQQIRDFLQARGKNEIAETLGVQPQQIPAQAAPAQKPTLPRDHLLTGGFAQSEQIVMTIRTGELPPIVNPALTADAPRYYWRSTAYDLYVGAGWVTSAAPPQPLPANTPLIPGLLKGYRTLHIDVDMAEPEGKLFWSGILFSADVPIRADWRHRPQSNLFADQSTLLQADLFAAASKARSYQAESYVPLVTIEDLRHASTDYPEIIRERYLQLPRSVPERVRELAAEITKDSTTAYDKAKAIEAFLRTYPYDLEVPAPPPDLDVADYFLFDLKKGYCDYYATAMVVLARASGLPARFVSGYASGSYDAANAEYVVRELHAHSWAEIYFPEIGWIEFEPTAAQPEIELPPSEQEIVNAQPDTAASLLLNRFRLEQLLYWLSPVAIILIALLLYFAWIERWLYMRLAPATAVEKIYRRLYRLGRPLAGERTKAETAHEFMEKLVRKVNQVKNYPRFRNFFSSTQDDIETLTNMYQDTLFTDIAVGKRESGTALSIWKHLRRRLLVARISLFIDRVFWSRRSLQRIARLFGHRRTLPQSDMS